jgi:phosphoribosylcarboxyaminoimidazole (NCAIR) mutase
MVVAKYTTFAVDMKTLKVIISKANAGVSAHLPEMDGYVIANS